MEVVLYSSYISCKAFAAQPSCPMLYYCHGRRKITIQQKQTIRSPTTTCIVTSTTTLAEKPVDRLFALTFLVPAYSELPTPNSQPLSFDLGYYNPLQPPSAANYIVHKRAHHHLQRQRLQDFIDKGSDYLRGAHATTHTVPTSSLPLPLICKLLLARSSSLTSLVSVRFKLSKEDPPFT